MASDQEFIQAALALSNKYRAQHGAPPLALDTQLCADAQKYAEYESQAHVQKHSMDPLDQYGENLAYDATNNRELPRGAAAAEWAVNKWYAEIALYPFGNPDPASTGEMHKWGHFTALVWKSCTKMGIGIAYGTKMGKSGSQMNTMHVVARYLPPGNMWSAEDMKANVLPAQY